MDEDRWMKKEIEEEMVGGVRGLRRRRMEEEKEDKGDEGGWRRGRLMKYLS